MILDVGKLYNKIKLFKAFLPARKIANGYSRQ